MNKFVVIGLPRSGSTYVSTLLHSHPDIHSAGELFNPYEIIEVEHDSSDESVFARDARPLRSAADFFENAESAGVAAAGFKFMIGHNVSVLQWIAQQPDIRIIFIRRENKLAQVSSFMKAIHTQEWARTTPPTPVQAVMRDARTGLRSLLPFARKRIPEKPAVSPHPDLDTEGRLTLGPRRISLRWHEMATSDYLFNHWLQSVPNKVMRITYTEMRHPGMPKRLCKFLDVPMADELSSPLVKQGTHRILDRFTYPDPIKTYFERRGLGKWLGEEVPAEKDVPPAQEAEPPQKAEG